ncbi:MAG: HD domain-containing protein [Magnetococcales bacterium]|nr:HD domain-containing protein [Magnetococcales bacterium]
MPPTLRLTLTPKILLLALAGFAVTILLVALASEDTLEEAMLDQVYKQAQSYLQGIALHLESMPADAPPEQYRTVLLKSLSLEKDGVLQFSPVEIYLYASTGQVLAHSEPGIYLDKPMDGIYGKVIREGKPAASKDLSSILIHGEQSSHPTIDIIVPVRLGGDRYNAGLEAELDLEELRRIISINDNAYEKRILLLTTACGILLFLFVWWLMHRLVIRHVKTFAGAAHDFGSGDPLARIPMPLPNDEIGDLGRTFNAMADDIGKLLNAQEEAYLQTMRVLGKALSAKDAYTQSHSARVARYAVMLGRHLGLDEEKLSVLHKGALMHDLGKIGIPDAILNKPGPLTNEEYAVMRTHASLTATIMRPLHRLHDFLDIAAWHHEHWDGTGYPDGLSGESIPLLARIVSIADTWDAMTGDRVYRKGMPPEKALGILETEWNRGQWDPELVKRFTRMIRETEPPA